MNSSKCKNLISNEKPSEYLQSIPSKLAKILMIEKLNMTKVKTNYKGNYENIKCSICQDEEETTLHLLKHHQTSNPPIEIVEIYQKFKNRIDIPALELKLLANTISSTLEERDKLLCNGATGSSLDEVTI